MSVTGAQIQAGKMVPFVYSEPSPSLRKAEPRVFSATHTCIPYTTRGSTARPHAKMWDRSRSSPTLFGLWKMTHRADVAGSPTEVHGDVWSLVPDHSRPSSQGFCFSFCSHTSFFALRTLSGLSLLLHFMQTNTGLFHSLTTLSFVFSHLFYLCPTF